VTRGVVEDHELRLFDRVERSLGALCDLVQVAMRNAVRAREGGVLAGRASRAGEVVVGGIHSRILCGQ